MFADRFFLLFAALLLAPFARSEVVKLRADAWCPYTCIPGSDKPGFIVEIAKKALEPAGFTVDYQILNWARSIAETRKGKFAGIIGASKDDAPDFIFPSEAVAEQKMCFFVEASSTWRFESLASLPSILLGAIKDYAYTPEIDSYIKQYAADPKRIDLVASDEPLALNIKKLSAKRIGAFIDDHNASHTMLKALGSSASSIKEAGCASSSNLYLAFSPKHPQAKYLAQLVQDKILAMRRDGSLKILLNHYGVEDWKKN